MPTGRVKWYDAEKGFGFLAQEGGEDVYVRSSALPEGTPGLKAGTRVEFDIAAGRRGDQALRVRVLDAPPSVSKALRRKPADMVSIIEDLHRLLDGVEQSYRRGRYPERRTCKLAAEVVRAVGRDLDG